MIQGFMRSMGTWLDLAALITLIGAAWSLLWIVPRHGEGDTHPKVFSDRVRRLLFFCLTVLVISSIAGLIQRSMEMSGVGVVSILPVLPTVMFKTHYGRMWLVRLAGLVLAWIVMLISKRHTGFRILGALLLLAGAIIAFSRSASGHPADFGDLSPQQIADWLHLMAVASWGGAVFTLAIILSPSLPEGDSLQQRLVAGIADRFYLLFGPVLSVLVFTGLYSAWVEVGSFRPLATTPYGRLLSAKLLLFLLLTLRYIAPPEHGQDEARFSMKFVRRTRVEAIVIIGILLSVSFLVQEVPARHFMHLAHMQGGDHAAHMHHAAQGPEPAVSLELRPENVTTGVPVDMIVRIKNQDGSPLAGLEVSHERMLHAIIISKDLNIFAHIHPEDIGPVTGEMVKQATFPLLYAFPKAGEYLVGLDFAAADNLYSKTFSVNVAGKPGMGEPKIDFSMKKNFGAYRVSLTISPESVTAGNTAKFSYIIEKDGKVVTDLEPYLGAAMHLAVVPVNLRLFIHAHGLTPEEPHGPVGHMHAAPPKRFGPEIEAEMVFPDKGVYKVFSQVKHQGKVLLFDFMVNVQ
jgi:copper resistance protein D